MTRFHDWDARLAVFLHERAHMPFAWGSNDCCTFAGDALLAMTGIDIAEAYRGRYTDLHGALAVMGELAGGGVTHAVEQAALAHGMTEVARLPFLQRGDLLLVMDAERPVAGILGLHGAPLCVGESGLHRLSHQAVRRAWRV